MVGRALLRRCPRCGRGGLFRRWFTMVEACPRCGLRFEREEGAFLGSLSLNYGVTGLTLIALLAIWIVVSYPDLNARVATIGSLVVLAIVPALFYPFSKTLWAAIDMLLHRMDPQDADTAWGGDPRS
ncbi:MAG TPA: DUF983 domain-containing protein [Actinomycetota bacterium]